MALKIMRKKLNISQEKFALQIDMDRTYYSSVEAGHRNISIINIQKIANGLGVSIAQIFKLAENIIEKEN